MKKQRQTKELNHAIKHDSSKPEMDLLSSKWLFGVAQVLTFGKKKYAAHNWRLGIESSRLLSALQRHLLAWNDGEDLDPETGLSHLYHASCCLMFLSELMITRPDLDTRYKLPCSKATSSVLRGTLTQQDLIKLPGLFIE